MVPFILPYAKIRLVKKKNHATAKNMYLTNNIFIFNQTFSNVI